jgi:putative oxidoreductase
MLLDQWRPFVLSELRIFAGLALMQHGTAKWLGFPVAPQFANTSIASLSGVAGLLELVVGALFVVGLFTRSAAFLLSGLLAAAYFIAHAPKGFFPLLNGGELAALYCFVFFYFVFAGPGPFSLDAWLAREPQREFDRHSQAARHG